jgi:hypothetical protein
MADEVHEVVTLLLARMESNPEEFEFHASGSLAVTGRWETWIAQLGWHFNEAEKALIYGKARELIFQRVHGEVLDELLNGEDRRRKEREEQEYERQMMRQSTLAQQQKAYVSQLQGMVGQVYGGGGGGGGGGAAIPGYQNAAGAQGLVGKSPTQLYGDYGIITGTQANSIMIDDQVLDAPMIKKIKKMLSGRSK